VTDDQLLFAAALANPAEDTPRLALADWFDEHDEPALAAALRAGGDTVAFLAELTRWDAPPTFRSRMYENGAARAVFPPLPAARLLVRYMAQFPVPPDVRTEFRENAPPPRAHRDPLDPATFLDRWQYERRRQVAAMRELAARNAAKRDPDRRAFETPPAGAREFEERCCLLHELVLRGRDPSAFPGAAAHAALMRERGHALSWLPLAPLAPDAGLAPFLPQFGGAGSWSAGGAPTTGPTLPNQTPGGAEGPLVLASGKVAPDAPLFAAVRGWSDESNGSLEGAWFRLDRPLIPEAVGGSWFARLPADVTGGALPDRWTVNPLPPGGALGRLFGAAHSGGAYGRGEWGAYGRLHAWRSLGALAGCDPNAAPEAVAAEAARCEWFEFGGTNWFVEIAWDLGLVCVRPDRLTVGLLAATDTD
jgi:uncharacterized protein (TIGR02996 family)